MTNISPGEAVLLSLLGFAIVFSVLVLLSFIIRLLSLVVRKIEGHEGAVAVALAAPAPAQAAAAPAAITPAAAAPAASGAVPGQAMIHGVPPRTAAILMAIVADESGIPPEELRIVSITQLDK